MTVLQEHIGHYLSSFEEFQNHRPASEPVWLGEIRKEAISSFHKVGFPTPRHEEWRKTNVKPIVETRWTRGAGAVVPSQLLLAPFLFGGSEASQLVFVDGVFHPELSSTEGLSAVVRIGNLASVVQEQPCVVEAYLSRLGTSEKTAFAALNTAFMEDGAYVHVPEGVVVEQPIHFLYYSTGEEARVTYPRNLLIVGNQAHAALIESYAGPVDGRYLTNQVTELIVGENARVDHYKIQRESGAAHHISNTQIYIQGHAAVSTFHLTLGGAITRNDIDAVLDAEGIELNMNGFYMVGGTQHVDNHTLIVHEKPHCSSHELFKGILRDQSRGVFRGKIFVQKDAQKTDAIQNSKSLLLSDDAEISAMPQLEIYADDVKCTHGATTGHLDEEAVFYLQSRGIRKEAAKGLLTYAFANDLISRIEQECVRDELDAILHESLPITL
jgi:Fe-S cluster assembly protein SufD